MSVILHSISDFEIISDHALDIAKSAKEIYKKELSFSQSARREIVAINNAVMDIIRIFLMKRGLLFIMNMKSY